MIVSIHQPETYPQLGYFNKIFESDVFVFLDSVAFRKNYFQNRNRVCSKNGDVWLTLPVSGDALILEKGYDGKALQKHEKTISNIYGKGAVQDIVISVLRECDAAAAGSLSEFNIQFISKICTLIGIDTRFVRSSVLAPKNAKSELILELCQAVEAKNYLSGVSGRDYLNLDEFNNAGINVLFQRFNYPTYRQYGGVFNKYASVIDVLCMNGIEQTAQFVKNGVWEKA
jgi:hypothetical protein